MVGKWANGEIVCQLVWRERRERGVAGLDEMWYLGWGGGEIGRGYEDGDPGMQELQGN